MTERNSFIHLYMKSRTKILTITGATFAASLLFGTQLAHADSIPKLTSQKQSLEQQLVQLKANQSKTEIMLSLEDSKKSASSISLQAQKINTKAKSKEITQKIANLTAQIDTENARITAEKARQKAEAEKQAEEQRLYALAHPSYTNTETNSYPQLQCTWGAKVLAPWTGNYWGNASQWAASALSEGFTVNDTPAVGSLVVWNDGAYGHVAYVTGVRSRTEIQVLEANYGGSAYAANPKGIQNYRGWFNPIGIQGSVSYIHPK